MPAGDPSRPNAPGFGPEVGRDRHWSDLVLLLITVALVVAGLVLLIVGYVQSSMAILYASIGSAALAGVVLIVFSRLNRRRALAVAANAVGPYGARPDAVGADADGADAVGADAGEADVRQSGAAGADAGEAGGRQSGAAGAHAGEADAGGADAAPSEPAATRPEPGPVGDPPGKEPTQG